MDEWTALDAFLRRQSNEPPPSIGELFDFIENNFDKLENTSNLKPLLPVVHFVVSQEHAEPEPEPDIGAYLLKMLNSKKEKGESALVTVLQIIYQVLNTLQTVKTPNTPHFSPDVFFDLIDLLYNGQYGKKINANILTCLQLYVHKYRAINVLKTMVNQMDQLTPPIIQSLIHLIDLFLEYVAEFCKGFGDIVLMLLDSDVAEERKAAYFLLQKLIQSGHIDCEVFRFSAVESGDAQRKAWTTYLTIMKNLEENQSHLILPSLATLHSIQGACAPDADVWWEQLHTKILKHNNILVTRWGVEYFLRAFSVHELNDDLLENLLIASNNTRLYKHEAYFIPLDNMEHFLAGDLTDFVETMTVPHINWKSVPLHFWLVQLNAFAQPSLSITTNMNVVLALAAKVRGMRNLSLRKDAITLFEHIFVEAIREMTLRNYLLLVESLYNVKDIYGNHAVFVQKLRQCTDYELQTVQFSTRLYELLTEGFNAKLFRAYCPDIIQRLRYVPKEDHGALRFIIALDAFCDAELAVKATKFSVDDEALLEFCKLKYEIDHKALEKSTFAEIRALLCGKLVWEAAERGPEERIVEQKAIDYFVCRHLRNFGDWQQMNLGFSDILSCGSRHTLSALSELLYGWKGAVDESLLLAFGPALDSALRVNNHNIIRNLFNYCKEHKLSSVAETLSCVILDNHASNVYNVCAVLFSGITLKSDDVVKGLLQGTPEIGETRIEEVYAIHMRRKTPEPNHVQSKIRYWYQILTHIRNFDLVDVLLDLNSKLSSQKPRYFENSQEHRLKMRIGSALCFLLMWNGKRWSEGLWSALLDQNNQPNVTYMYECMIAHCAPTFDVVLEKLNQISTYTASQQLSVISVVHCFCMLKPKQISAAELKHIIRTLLPLTMGPNFQTRTNAQLTILKILKSPDIDARVIPHAGELLAGIETAMGDKLYDLMLDLRMELPKLCTHKNVGFPNALFYITNAPIDEYLWTQEYAAYDDAKMRFARRNVASAKQTTTEESEKIMDDASNVQRKMNPSDCIRVNHNFMLYPEQFKKYEMYVVASLINKLPNVGGIARTCEVLGIKNLVMNCKADVEKNDFKSLSMTAEKTLNILEVKPAGLVDFLLQKQVDGFKIVGAEQTAKSVSFVDFKFPEKCILLLGHEKEGLPSNLMDFLDYAVEIPQSGMVRSLNVHVTAALFMWEYCKQHALANQN